MADIQSFKIDQAATFAAVVFLQCEPKLRFGSTEQETRKQDGLLKWEVQVLGAFRDTFGKIINQVVKIGVAADRDPGKGMTPYTPVTLRDFEVGVMERTKKNADGSERVVGVQVWYRCSEVRSTAATAPKAA